LAYELPVLALERHVSDLKRALMIGALTAKMDTSCTSVSYGTATDICGKDSQLLVVPRRRPGPLEWNFL